MSAASDPVPHGIELDVWVWTPERIAELTRLWADKIPTAEMGRRMGCSKNAIISKVHRLFLPPRGVTRVPPQAGTALLSEIDVAGCRYIKGNPLPLRPGMYCGEKVAAPEFSYCPTHHARCHVYTPPAKD